MPAAGAQFLAPAEITVHSFIEDETGLPRYGMDGAVLLHREPDQADLGYTARFVRNRYVFIAIRFSNDPLPSSPPPRLSADANHLPTAHVEQLQERADDGAVLERSILTLTNTAYYRLAHADTAWIRWGARRVPFSWSDRAPLRRLFDAVEDD